jgi:hypothetical protein
MSGIGREVLLQQERRLRAATEAVESAHLPIAEALHALQDKLSALHTEMQTEQERIRLLVSMERIWEDERAALRRSFWRRLCWLWNGRAD